MNVEKKGSYVKVKDSELGIDAYLASDGTIKGKGSRKYKDIIEKSISEYVISETKKDMNFVANYKEGDELSDEYMVKYADYSTASSYLSSIWGGTSDTLYSTVTKENLRTWLQQPVRYNKQLRDVSMYWYGLKGEINRTYELYKNIHSLDSNLKIDNPLKEDLKELMLKISKFDKGINKKPNIRDIIFQTAAEGTAIGYIHGTASNKYVQLLDLTYYLPKDLVNGAWQVEVDLLKFTTTWGDYTKDYPADYMFTEKELNPKAELLSQPQEVQLAFKAFQSTKKSMDRHYKLSQSKTFVIKIMSKQGERLGRPAGAQAFSDLLHKELIRDAEVALIDRIINMILVMKLGIAGDTQKEGYRPKKEEHKTMAQEVRKALTNNSLKGLKFVGIPFWADIEQLKTDLTLFDKDKYESIDNDIATALGINGLLANLDNSSFASGQLSINLFMTNVYSILEQIEENLFNYQYNLLVPESTVTFKREFNRTMVLDNKAKVEILKGLLDKGGAVKPMLDAIGVDFEEYIAQVKYEKETTKVNDLFIPFITSYTQSGTDNDDVGRPNTTGKTDNGNSQPKPSTE